MELFPPSNYFALLFPSPRSERTVACAIRRDLVFKMELQLALLFAGIIAFSDSARGKGTTLGTVTLWLCPFPLLRGLVLHKHPLCPRRCCCGQGLVPCTFFICTEVQARAHLWCLLTCMVWGRRLGWSAVTAALLSSVRHR